MVLLCPAYNIDHYEEGDSIQFIFFFFLLFFLFEQENLEKILLLDNNP